MHEQKAKRTRRRRRRGFADRVPSRSDGRGCPSVLFPQRHSGGVELEQAGLKAKAVLVEVMLEPLPGEPERPGALAGISSLVPAERQVQVVAAAGRRQDDGLAFGGELEDPPDSTEDVVPTQGGREGLLEAALLGVFPGDWRDPGKVDVEHEDRRPGRASIATS